MVSRWAEQNLIQQLKHHFHDMSFPTPKLIPNCLLNRSYKFNFIASQDEDKLAEFAAKWKMSEIALMGFHYRRELWGVMLAEQIRVGWSLSDLSDTGFLVGNYAIYRYEDLEQEEVQSLVVINTEYTDLKVCIYSHEPLGMSHPGWKLNEANYDNDSWLQLPNMQLNHLVHWIELEEWEKSNEPLFSPVVSVRRGLICSSGLLVNIDLDQPLSTGSIELPKSPGLAELPKLSSSEEEGEEDEEGEDDEQYSASQTGSTSSVPPGFRGWWVCLEMVGINDIIWSGQF